MIVTYQDIKKFDSEYTYWSSAKEIILEVSKTEEQSSKGDNHIVNNDWLNYIRQDKKLLIDNG